MSLFDILDVFNWIDRLELLIAAAVNRRRGAHHQSNTPYGMIQHEIPRSAGLSGEDIERHLRDRGVRIHGRRITGSKIIYSTGAQQSRWSAYLARRLQAGSPHTNTWASRKRGR